MYWDGVLWRWRPVVSYIIWLEEVFDFIPIFTSGHEKFNEVLWNYVYIVLILLLIASYPDENKNKIFISVFPSIYLYVDSGTNLYTYFMIYNSASGWIVTHKTQDTRLVLILREFHVAIALNGTTTI